MNIFVIVIIAAQLNNIGCFVANWGIYPYVESNHVTPSVSASSVVFRHIELPFEWVQLTFRQSITILLNDYNSSQSAIGDTLQMTTQNFGKQLSLNISLSNPSKSQQTDFTLQTHLQTSKLSQTSHKFKQLCTTQSQSSNSTSTLYSCKLSTNSTQVTLMLTNEVGENSVKSNTSQIRQQNLRNFMNKNRIELNDMNIKAVKMGITNLINSICLFGKQFVAKVGFCNAQGQFEFKFSPMVITILMDYDKNLAEFLAKNYLDELEVEVMYPRDLSSQIMPIPEYLDFFMIFTDSSTPLKGSEILNSIFSKLMLNQITHLHEQLNYRQAKKLHPYLVQMLTQPWSTNHQLNQFKSVYTESFTEDFRYHSYGDRLSQCITKNSWIYNAIETCSSINTYLLQQSRSKSQVKQQMIEYTTLLSLYKTFISEESKAKTGSYSDIYESRNGNQFYSRFVGYGNVLPYVYRAGDVLPLETIKMLSSPFGLKSSTQSVSNQTQFRYRGNVHAYFNYRILRGIKNQLISQKQQEHQQTLELLNDIWNSVQKTVKNQLSSMETISTSWSSANGQSKQRCGWLQIVSVLFLGKF